MKLSIIMPCYNKPSFLIEMIKSIQAQTLKDWELIIVDDGSEEKNFNQVLSFVSSDNRIKFIRRNREPKNGDTCRNMGMERAKGEYIIIFDSDDLVSKNCFEQRVNFMDSNKDCDYATFPAGYFFEGEKKIKNRKFDKTETDILGKILSADYPFTVWANIYRRLSLNNIRWDENVFIYQDFDFMVQCALKGLTHKWAEASSPDYFYRIFRNGNSVCNNVISEQKVKSTEYLFRKILSQLNTLPNKEERKIQFFNFMLMYVDQLLLSNNIDYIQGFLDIQKEFFPSKYETFKKIAEKSKNHVSNHFDLFNMYRRLYFAFKYPTHKSYMIHEFAKTLLLKN